MRGQLLHELGILASVQVADVGLMTVRETLGFAVGVE